MKEPLRQPRRIDPARLMAVIALWLITAVSFLVFFDRTGYLRLTRNWLFLLAVGLCCTGAYFRSPPRGLYLLGPVFLLWLALSALIRGDSTLGQLPAQTPLVEQSIIFCMAFPFARLIRDPDRQQLNRLLLAVVCLMAVMIWLCLIGTLTGRNISLFHRLVFGASYTATGRLKLKVLNLHYYHLGYLSVICFFITLYLAASRPRARWRPLWLLLLATFAAAVLLTYSRNAVMALLLGGLMALWLLLERLIRRKKLRRIIFWSLAAVSVLLTCAAMNTVYRAVRSIRDVWYGLDTLSSRTEIWSGGIRALISQPQALLTGFPPETGMDTVNQFIRLSERVSHMHSGFLEMLICFGLPGLFLLLLFTAAILKRSFSLFADSGRSVPVRLLTLIPIALTLMNVFDCLFPFESRVPLLIPLLHALVSGCIVEICRKPAGQPA